MILKNKNFWVVVVWLVAVAVAIDVYFVRKYQEVPPPLPVGTLMEQKPVVPRFATTSPSVHLDDAKLAGMNVTQELSARWGALTPPLDINQDVPLWPLRWVNAMRYTLSVPANEFVAGTFFAPFAVANAADTFFTEELRIVRDVFERRGFVLNELNSSTSTSDTSFYNYVQAYEKGDKHCSAVVSLDGLGYSKGYTNIGYSLYVMCIGDITSVEAEQIPLLDALGYRGTDMSLSGIKKEGDFVEAGISFIHGGESVFFKKEGRSYRVLLKTQESPRCEIVDKEGIPESFLKTIGFGSCYEEDGSLRRVQ